MSASCSHNVSYDRECSACVAHEAEVTQLAKSAGPEFVEWFKDLYGDLPDPGRVREISDDLQRHVSAINKLGLEKRDLEYLQQAWDLALPAWDAAKKLPKPQPT